MTLDVGGCALYPSQAGAQAWRACRHALWYAPRRAKAGRAEMAATPRSRAFLVTSQDLAFPLDGVHTDSRKRGAPRWPPR